MQIEAGSIQKAQTLTNNIKDKLGDKMETNIQRPRKPRLKIHIPEEISTDNIEGTLIAQNTNLGIEKGEIIPKFTYETKTHSEHSNRSKFPHKEETDTEQSQNRMD